MGDQQPRRGIGGISLGADLNPVLDLVTQHRAKTGGRDEVARLTVVGWPPGRTVRVAKVLAGVIALVVVVAIGSQFIQASFVLGVTIGVLVALAFVAVVLVTVGRTPSARWNPLAIMLTNRRLIIARGSSRGPYVDQDDPAAAITWGQIDVVESFWLRSSVVPVVTLGGASGAVTAVELPKVEVAAARALVRGAGLRLVASSAT